MLARQLLIGFLAVIVPSTIVLGAVTFYSLTAMRRLSDEFVEITHSDEAVTDLHMTLTQAGTPLGFFLLTGNPAHRRRFEDLILAAEKRLASCGTEACHSASQAPGRMAAGLAPAIERIKRDGRLVFEEGAGGGAARVEAVRRSVDAVRSVTEPMLQAIHARGDQLAREVAWVRRRARLLTAGLGVAIVLAGAGAAMLIARRIARPLHGLLRGIRRVMAGDWSYQVRTPPAGEIGELASAFNAMVREVRERRAELEEHNRTLEERVRRRTEELRQKEHALVQSEKLASLGLLAAGVAHELNNPLTSIVLNTNLMLEEADEGSQLHGALRKVDADAARCRRIVEDLKTFAHVRQVERAPTTVETLVGQALASTAHELDRRAVTVERDLARDLPKVPCDPTRMVQVLVNLLVNAAQAARPGGRIRLRACDDGEWVRFEVADEGPGIPVAHRSRIFDPFFTTKPDGTGLGLSISHGIVSEHGGRIEVESWTRDDAGPDGRTGTLVRVLVPVQEAGQ